MYQYQNMGIRRRIGGCITGIVILLLIAGGLVFVVTRVRNGITLPVGTHPTIIGDDCGGTVLIQAGAEHQVTIEAQFFPQYTQDSASNTVEITSCDNGLTLTVPPEADLQMSVIDNITVLGVSGTLKVDTNGSRITLEQVTLEGQSKIDDNGGQIIFSGTIATGASPTISDNSGSIDAALPANASFSLDLSGILGPIASDFPGLQNPAADAGDQHFILGNTLPAFKLSLELNDTALILSKNA